MPFWAPEKVILQYKKLSEYSWKMSRQRRRKWKKAVKAGNKNEKVGFRKHGAEFGNMELPPGRRKRTGGGWANDDGA